MRRLLDGLYLASGWLAASFLLAILLTVLAQVGLNLLDAIYGMLTGSPLGLLIPSYAEFAGFFLAAATFFALAYTFRSGSHIRVTLLIRNFTGTKRRWIEAWCSGAVAAAALYFGWYVLDLTRESYRFGDLSPGLVPVPLWIPQAAMTAGLAVLAIACLDEFQRALRGVSPAYLEAESSGETTAME